MIQHSFSVVALDARTAQPIVGATVLIAQGENQRGITNQDGYAIFTVNDGLLTYAIDAAGYPYHQADVLVTENLPITVPLTRTLPAIQRVYADGLHFRTEDGKVFLFNEATNFLIGQRFLEGQDVANVLYPGPEIYRYTIIMKFIPNLVGFRDLTPEAYGEQAFWDSVNAFPDYLASQGKRGEATLFCDLQLIGRDKDLQWQRRVFGQAVEILRSKSNIFFSLGNEWQKNGFNPKDFSKPAGLISSNGSNIFEVVPVTLGWDYIEIHPRRDPPKHLKNCESTELQYSVIPCPIAINEPFGAGPVAIPNKRYTDRRLFEQLRKLMDACNGGTFHSDAGVTSTPLSGVEQSCLDAYNNAA